MCATPKQVIINIDETPPLIPMTSGSVFRNPKFAAEEKGNTLFAPGVTDATNVNPINPGSLRVSPHQVIIDVSYRSSRDRAG